MRMFDPYPVLVLDTETGGLSCKEHSLLTIAGIAWSADEDLTFDFFNARWAEVTGVAPPKSLEDWRAHIHPDEFDATIVSARSDP